MPRRVTIDANGCVILVESVPEREPPPKPKRGKIPVDITKKFEWTEDKARKTSRASFKSKTKKKKAQRGQQPLGPRVHCLECRVDVQKANWENHIRKLHTVKEAGVSCPVCHSMVEGHQLGKHLLNCHRDALQYLQPEKIRVQHLTTMQVLDGEGSWVSCSLCRVNVKERNWQKHLGKFHPFRKDQHERKSMDRLKPSTKPSPQVPGQPERSVADGRSEYARKLLRELHEEAKIGHGEKVHSASSSDAAPKGIRQLRGESKHPANVNTGKVELAPTNRSTSKSETKKQAQSVAQGIVAKQKRAEKLRSEIKAIDKELKKLAPGFHRIKIAALERKQGGLRTELEKLERTLLGNASAQGRFPGRAGRLGARTEQHQEDLLRQRAENEYGGST